MRPSCVRVAPAKVVDMGCGPGNSTELIVACYPQAEIVGLDSSPKMLEEARKRLPQIRFAHADATSWVPDGDVELVFANAIYQWVPNHLEQLPRVLAALRPDAVLAVQMPDNVAEPSHALMYETAQDLRWAARLADAVRPPLSPASAYYDALRPFARRLDLWHTAYHHVLADAAAIVEWVSSTGLRPFLGPLDAAQRTAFLDSYSQRIARAYPPVADGKVLLRYPRFFIVAQR